MKKFAFITVIAALLLLASCNVDSEHGIYYQVNTSQPSSGINIIQSLGCYKYEDTVYHVFLSDNGICVTTAAKGDTETAEATKGRNIRGAFFAFDSAQPDTSVLYFIDSEGRAYKFDPSAEEITRIIDTETFNGLTSNGYLFNNITVRLLPTLDSETGINLTSMPLSSRSAALFMDGSNTAQIFKGSISSPLEVTGFKAKATGFAAALGASTYFVFDEKNVYEVSDTDAALGESTLLCSGLEAAPTGGYKAVHYYDETAAAAYLLVRTSKGFTKINKDGEVIEKNVQFLSSLNDVVVLDMYTIEDSSKIAIVTYANGIRIADMEAKTVSDDIL